MTSDEQKIETLRMIAENFGVVLSERAIFMWLGLLEDYTLPEIQKAAMNLIRHAGNNEVAYKTMPPFALMQKELDKICGAVTDPEEKLTLLAETAWSGLLTAINRYGSYRMPDDLDDTTLYCLRSMGGWQVACNWLEDDLHWRKKEFVELYKTAHGRTDALMLGVDAVEALGNGKREPSAIGSFAKDFLDSIKPQGLPQ